MKILLEECVTKRLKKHLRAFEVYTVTELGWNGIKNGMLMTLCVKDSFDMLITIDKNMMFQQNIEKYNLTIVVFDSLQAKLKS